MLYGYIMSTLDQPPHPRVLLGASLALLSAASFGVMVVFGRWAYADGVTPMSLLFLRFLIASSCLWCAVIALRLARPTPRAALVSTGMGAIFFGNAGAYFVGLSMAPAGAVAMLFYVYPALVAFAGWLLLGERIRVRGAVALVLALLGAAVTIGWTGASASAGLWLAVGAAVFYSAYVLVGRKFADDTHPLTRSALVTTSAALLFALAAFQTGLTMPRSAQGWVSVICIALVSTVFGITAFLTALKHLRSSSAATLSAVEPVVAAVAAAAMLGEPITSGLAVGATLILFATVLIVRDSDG